MGLVYRARDTRLRRDVALKILRPSRDDGRPAGNSLLREARAAAALNHPNICTVHEVGEIDGTSFIAMELVAGTSLQAILARGRLTAARVTRIGRQLADALEHAHANGVVHRDFKSANVVITADGRAKVLDFGIAARTPEALAATATLTMADDDVAIAGTRCRTWRRRC
jgi:serine/threonine protein kinase